MEIKKISVEQLKAAEYNPRKDLKPGDPEYEKLKRSIKEFGYVEPIIWNKRTGTVVGGHQRLKVLIDLGATEVDCVIVDLDKDKEKALNIALNKISGSWDEILLTNLLQDLEQSGYDITMTGFDLAEIKDLFGSGSMENVEEDNFDADKALEDTTEPVTRPGDLWVLGKHRLLCGDSTKPGDAKRVLNGRLADIMVTDPPYNVDYGTSLESRGMAAGRDIANDNLSDSDFYEFLSDFYEAAEKNLRPGAAAYIFHSTKETINFIQAMVNAGFKYAQTLVWYKNHFTLGRQDYQWIHEPILYGWKEGAGHYFIDDRTNQTVFENGSKDVKKMSKNEMQSLLEKVFALQNTVLHDNKPTRSPDHPTMKPITLCAKLIYNSSLEGDTVYEPFGGSGSTLIAAEQLNRKCCVIELDPKYCDVIVKRFYQNFPGANIGLFRGGEELDEAKYKVLLTENKS
jgi:DNA modification methylase